MDGLERPFPQARMSDLVAKEFPGEILIYDLNSHQAHCLNQTTALVWQHCDGKSSITAITQAISQELKADVHEEIIWIALEQLNRSKLLENKITKPTHKAAVSRRQALRQAALMAVAAPMVLSIIAPTAQAASTCVGQTGLTPGLQCEFPCQCISNNCEGTTPKCADTADP